MAGREGIKAGRAFVELGVNDKLAAGLKRASRHVKQFGQQIGDVGAGMAKLGAVIVGPLAAAAKIFSGMGDQLAKMSTRTGISVESLSQLRFAAEQSGTSLETLEKGVKTMQRSINDAERGLSTATDALGDLGLSVADLQGLSPEQQFKLIADRLSNVGDAGKRAATAMMIFGRAGTEMLPMIADGAAGIEKLMKKADAMGLTISTEAAQAAADFTDKMGILWDVIKINAFEIGASLAPAIIDLANKLIEIAKSTVEWIRRNQEMIVWVAKLGAVVTVAGVGLMVLAKAIAAVSVVMNVAAVATKVLFAALTLLAAHPVIAAIIAVAAAIGAIIYVVKNLDNEEGDLDRQRESRHQAHLARLEEEKAAYEKREAGLRQVAILEKRLADLRKRDAEKEASQSEQEIANIRKVAKEKHAVIDQLWTEYEKQKAANDKLQEEAGIRADAESIERSKTPQTQEAQEARWKINQEERSEFVLRKKAEKDRRDELVAENLKVRAWEADEIVNVHGRAAAKQAAEDARLATQAAERRLGFERDVQDDIARLQIETTKEGSDKARALLKLDEQNELRSAAEHGANLEMIRRKYELRGKLLDMEGVDKMTRTIEAKGTFNASAILGLQAGGPAERTANAADQIVKNTKKIIENTGTSMAFA